MRFSRTPGSWLRKLADRLPGFARDESGFAIPAALLISIAAASVATIGVIAAVRTEEGTTRDRSTKSAFQVAESGINDALLRYNRYPPTAGNLCSPVGGAATSGWCGPVTGTLDGNPYTYYVRPPAGGRVDIVSSATVNGATRRVAVTANSISDQPFFGDWAVQSHNDIHLKSNASINTNVAANGDVILDSNSSLCGNAQHGPGHDVETNGNATHTCGIESEGQIIIPPVNQGDAPTVNDNSRFFDLDVITGNKTRACFNGVNGNGSPDSSCGARHLNIASNTSVTLGGSKYSFCKLTLGSNTNLYIQAGKTVTIYFDSPEACGYSSGTYQLDMDSNARISGTSGSAASAAFMFVGSPVVQTRINLSSNTAIGANCQQNFIIYAPFSDVELNSNTAFCGAIAANSLEMDSNSSVRTSSAAQQWVLPAAHPHYTMTNFVECAAAAAGPTTSGC